ncbi:MAG: hypothetical protein ACR2M0_05065 [Chloroflexia bacterium]
MQNSIKRAKVLSVQIVSLNIQISLRPRGAARSVDRQEAAHAARQLARRLDREREEAHSRLLLHS